MAASVRRTPRWVPSQPRRQAAERHGAHSDQGGRGDDPRHHRSRDIAHPEGSAQDVAPTTPTPTSAAPRGTPDEQTRPGGGDEQRGGAAEDLQPGHGGPGAEACGGAAARRRGGAAARRATVAPTSPSALPTAMTMPTHPGSSRRSRTRKRTMRAP